MDDSKVNQVVVPAAAATPNAVLLPGQKSLAFAHALYHFTFVLPWNPVFFPLISSKHKSECIILSEDI